MTPPPQTVFGIHATSASYQNRFLTRLEGARRVVQQPGLLDDHALHVALVRRHAQPDARPSSRVAADAHVLRMRARVLQLPELVALALRQVGVELVALQVAAGEGGGGARSLDTWKEFHLDCYF